MNWSNEEWTKLPKQEMLSLTLKVDALMFQSLWHGIPMSTFWGMMFSCQSNKMYNWALMTLHLLAPFRNILTHGWTTLWLWCLMITKSTHKIVSIERRNQIAAWAVVYWNKTSTIITANWFIYWYIRTEVISKQLIYIDILISSILRNDCTVAMVMVWLRNYTL